MRITTKLAACGSLLLALAGRNSAAFEAPLPDPPAIVAPALPGGASVPTVDSKFHIDAKQTLTYLASDDLEGRGIDTPGLDKAADYIADAFGHLGLKPLGDKEYFQTFQMTTTVSPGKETTLAAAMGGDDGAVKYTTGAQFTPIGFTGEGTFEAPIVFAGYGITNPTVGYDDYAGLDVKDKVVIVLRYEPHDAEGKSRFAKSDWSADATLDRKMKVAVDRGAKAVVLVNPPTFNQGDLLISFERMYRGEQGKLPLVQVTQETVNRWLKASGSEQDLKGIQAKIDESGKPSPLTLPKPITVSGTIKVDRIKRDVKNVVGLIPGEGPHADEYVIVGAHYDHLGRGGPGSLAPNSHEIHHGADDNASGTTSMMQLAEHFAKKKSKPARSMIFVAFTAEESGLIGSQHFVQHPPIPLEKVAAMLNLDMVGRVQDQKLLVSGQGTAADFEKIIQEADDASPLTLKVSEFGKGGLGPSDHMSFALKKVPVLFLFNGMHRDYHRPTDTADKINFDGMQQVVDLAANVVDKLLTMPKEQYVDAADSHSMGQAGYGGSKVTLGVIPDYGTEDVKGVQISGTVPGSPAEAAGLKGGDVITGFGEGKVENIYDLTNSLAKGKPGEKVKLKVLREGKNVDLEATLAERKG